LRGGKEANNRPVEIAICETASSMASLVMEEGF